ncbi:MAG TPA: DUF92 domain-containing protein, partial [Planctomycetota bacterium]|nr:DUF92 domain-containing protein [Planctomycetota bacterium]
AAAGGGAPSFAAVVAAAGAAAGGFVDTVSGELGMLSGATPRLLLFGPPVARGVDGGMTRAGTAWGVVAAVLAGAVGFAGFLPACTPSAAAAAAVATAVGGFSGTLFDSLIGAAFERRGRWGNQTTNFLSGTAAGLVAWAVAGGAR